LSEVRPLVQDVGEALQGVIVVAEIQSVTSLRVARARISSPIRARCECEPRGELTTCSDRQGPSPDRLARVRRAGPPDGEPGRPAP
jgi:hypothetical protein